MFFLTIHFVIVLAFVSGVLFCWAVRQWLAALKDQQYISV